MLQTTVVIPDWDSTVPAFLNKLPLPEDFETFRERDAKRWCSKRELPHFIFLLVLTIWCLCRRDGMC